MQGTSPNNTISKAEVDDRLLVSVEEACRLLSIGKTFLYELIDLGKLRTIKMGKCRRIFMSSIHEFLSEQEKLTCV